jgi:phage-related protein
MEERVITTILEEIKQVNPALRLKLLESLVSILKEDGNYNLTTTQDNLTTIRQQFNNNLNTMQNTETTIYNNETTIQDNEESKILGFIPNMGNLASIVEAKLKEYKPQIEEYVNIGKSWLQRAFNWVWNGLKDIYASVKNFFTEYFKNIVEAYEAIKEDLGGAFDKAAFFVRTTVTDIKEFVVANPVKTTLCGVGVVVALFIFPFILTAAKVSIITYAALSLAPLLLTLV